MARYGAGSSASPASAPRSFSCSNVRTFMSGRNTPSLGSSIVALPVHARRVRPQLLEGVVFAGGRVEDVDDDVAVILDDPLAGLVALDGQAAVPQTVHGGVDFFRDRVDLPAAGAGDEDEEVVQGGDAPHVEDQDVVALV